MKGIQGAEGSKSVRGRIAFVFHAGSGRGGPLSVAGDDPDADGSGEGLSFLHAGCRRGGPLLVAGDGPDADGSDADGSDADGPDADGPDADGPDADGPDADGPDADGSDADGPDADGPDADGPDADGPDADGSDADGPDADGPDADGSDADGPDADGSDADGPDADGSDADGSDADGPDADGSDADGLDADGPDADDSDADGPDADGPDADGPDADGPDADGSDADGPDADGPDADGSDADGPDADGPDADGSGEGLSFVSFEEMEADVLELDFAAVLRFLEDKASPSELEEERAGDDSDADDSGEGLSFVSFEDMEADVLELGLVAVLRFSEDKPLPPELEEERSLWAEVELDLDATLADCEEPEVDSDGEGSLELRKILGEDSLDLEESGEVAFCSGVGSSRTNPGEATLTCDAD
ncbi:hypothetical protein MMC22_005159 [Lobaria immixta]|nr:hypothetical protein [Lobaria immixta]